MENYIYLDAHASTPVDDRVLTTMYPYFNQLYGNGNHKMGRKAAKDIEAARFQVANLINANSSEIYFTSGATEAINTALLGISQEKNSTRNHIITQKTEHSAVLKCLEHLSRNGFRITYLEVDKVGRIDLNDFRNAITEDTLLVAIMLANNEIGTVQPIEEIGHICETAGAKFFCDITQGVEWYPLDMKKLNIDMAAFSSHKCYGPRGVGALYVRKKSELNLKPLMHGGEQEKGLRSGTHNLPAIVGFGKACEIIKSERVEHMTKVQSLTNFLRERISNSIPNTIFYGCPIHRHPGNLNISLPFMSGEALKELLPNVIFSTSSACLSQNSGESHVIQALPIQGKNSPFRIGIGRNNTQEEINYFADKIIELSLKQ